MGHQEDTHPHDSGFEHKSKFNLDVLGHFAKRKQDLQDSKIEADK